MIASSFSKSLLATNKKLVNTVCWQALSRSHKKCLFSTTAFRSKNNEISPKNILTLSERGLLEDMHPEASPQLSKILSKKKQCFYCGFDPTADSLHVGNLLSLMVLLHCQQSGHDVIALVGTATARTGDPSGRFTDRQVLEDSELDRNAKKIAENIRYIFNNYESDCFPHRDTKNLSPLKIVFNHEWYKEINVIDFVTTAFRDFRIANLMAMRSIRDRINSEESMLLSEFVYQVFQSFDWMHLHKKYKCNFQVGGIDQLCNVQAGVKLIRRNHEDSEEVYGLFTPLVTTPKGEKLGKSAGNSVWLNPEKTSPFEFYQYFFRQPDAVVESFLKYFTFINLKEISSIMTEHLQNPQFRKAQRILARNVTKIVHGTKGLESAERCTRALFGGKIEDLERLNENEIYSTFAGTEIIDAVLESDTTVLDALTMTKALRREENAEQIISAGGVRLNGQVTKVSHQILLSDIHVLVNNITLVTIGRKRHYLLKWSLPRIKHSEDDFRNPSKVDGKYV